MGKSANLRSPAARKTVWLVGGCHGTCFVHASDDEAGRAGRRQLLFANCIVLTLCAAVIAFVIALIWA